MKKLILLVTLLTTACGLQAQSLEKKVEKDAVIYTDGKKENLQKDEFHYAIPQKDGKGDSSEMKEITNAIGNRIIPDRVKEMLKAESKKEEPERGFFLISWVYDDRGNAVGAEISLSKNLAEEMTEEEINEIYRRLMKEKIEMKGKIEIFDKGELHIVEPGEKPRLSTWLFMYVAEKDFMMGPSLPSTVDLD